MSQRYVDGGYEIRLKRPYEPSLSRHFFTEPATSSITFSAEVTVVKEAGYAGVGVSCWSGPSLGYLLVVGSDGRSAIVEALDDASAEVLLEGDSPMFGAGDRLTLSIRCAGGGGSSTEVVGRMNGEEIARVEDAVDGLDAFSAIGLWSVSEHEGGTVRWDDALADAA